MKSMIRMFLVLSLLFIIVSCATTQPAIPEKYNLGNQLEEIKEITRYKVSSWETVDIQSIILRANMSDYYLLVLDRPIMGVISSESIGISSTVNTIKSGLDRIYVKDSAGTQYYVIDKIFKLNGRDQVKQIKEQLGKK